MTTPGGGDASVSCGKYQLLKSDFRAIHFQLIWAGDDRIAEEYLDTFCLQHFSHPAADVCHGLPAITHDLWSNRIGQRFCMSQSAVPETLA
jgi:hypothetical protein